MAMVWELQPGDLVRQDDTDMEATFITNTPHPLFHGLQLVIWKMPDGSWSLDALRGDQEIGHVVESTRAEREARLRGALLGG
jgi:hypothetical protein